MTSTGTAHPGDHLGDSVAVTEIRIAATAADAARATPGVVHLQPGLWGLVQQVGNELWTRATGQPRPDTAGVEVVVTGDAAAIDVALVTDGRRPAAQVAADVQRYVEAAVRTAHDVRAGRIAVHVVDIALPG